MAFEVKGYTRRSELSVYGQGQLPNMRGDKVTDETPLRFETIHEVIPGLMKFCGAVDKDTVSVVNRDGRIDITVIENRRAEPATVKEFVAWHAGKCKLWSTTYTFQVEEVIRRPVDMHPWTMQKTG